MLEDSHIIESEFQQYEIGSETVNVYTISDFMMLSNQGIFRDEIFLIDKERRWEKKTVKQVEEYGYIQTGFHPTNEITYLLFELIGREE